MMGRRGFLTILFLLIPALSSAATIASVRSGKWSDPALWNPQWVPGDGDDVVISDGHTVEIDRDIGTPGGGLRMLRVGTKNGSTAKLVFDGLTQPRGYKIIFGSRGKQAGESAFGILFWGEIDFQGTEAHPLTIEPRIQDGTALTFLHKAPESTQVRLTLRQVDLRFVGDEAHAGIEAGGANHPGDRLVFEENHLEQSGPLDLLDADGSVATIRVSGNTAIDHRGSFIHFKRARQITLEKNEITVASFPVGIEAQAVFDSREGGGDHLLIQGNTIISRINVDLPSPSPSPPLYGIWIDNVSDAVVRQNRIVAEGVAYGLKEGIALLGSDGKALRILVEANLISKTIHGIGIHTGVSTNPGVQISRNVILDNRNEHIFVSDGYQVRITNNLLFGWINPHQAGILLYNTDQVEIINNTLVGRPAAAVHGIAVGNPGVGTSRKVRIKNNILVNWGEAIQNRESGNSFAEVSHNLFSGNLKNYDLEPIPGAGAGDRSDPPGFNDPAVNDYHIRPDSPAVDGGDPTEIPAVDIDGQPRPEGNGVDIGADEFSTQPVQMLPPPPPSTPSVAPSPDSTNGEGAVSGGFGCGQVQPRSDGPRPGRSDGGDLLLILFPFLYWVYRYYARKNNARKTSFS
ncbi:MAG: right-handed parallel beta-helix repeat-containing protein [Candidatus Manganitrophaceae bacterium]|nr:MAG: right-handed parallel beta-helix repeat-containing protein [Candidatus Manganitrophaceae bacterium]